MEPITYGTIFYFSDSFYILSSLTMDDKPGNFMMLVNLSNGNRWSEPIRVDDFRNISLMELAKSLKPRTETNPRHIKEIVFANSLHGI